MIKYLLPLIFLVGCSTAVKKIETQEVYIPVSKTCYDGKTRPEKPVLYTDSITENTPLDEVLNYAFTDVNQLKVYSLELEVFICD